MKILCVGGAGQICRESIKDLVEFSDFKMITIADINEVAAREVIDEISDARVDFVKFDVTDTEKAIETIKRYDVVMASMPIKFDELVVDTVIKAGVSGLDITGMGGTYFDYDEQAKEAGIIYVPGVGMTPGTTNILTRYAADQMDKMDEIYISHGAFRAIAYSPGLSSTTFLEYDPNLPGRVVYDNGEYIHVPPFSLEKMVELPEPSLKSAIKTSEEEGCDSA